MRTERFKGALLTTLVIASLITPLLLLSPSPVHAALTPHAPIYINGNAGFTSPDPVNGGGSGTENDPYIIENYIIDASTANGIEIRNTTAYFVVRNCVVKNGWGAYNGIYLYNVVNGRAENNTCETNKYGIRLDYSSNNTLANNACENNGYNGISLYYSSYNTLFNNTCSRNDYDGITLGSYSSTNTLEKNTCKNNKRFGIYLSSSCNYNTLNNNACGNNRYYGIALDYSSNNTLSNNICENNLRGISLGGCSYATLSNNICSHNSYYGIYLWDSGYNTLDNNTCSNNSRYGIFLDSSTSSDHNTITNNTYSNNSRYGIYLYHSDNNLIYHNNFVHNENQAYDDGSNYWDNGYPSGGNYWSDYAGVDNYRGENQDILGSDGIGDTPYDVLGDSNQDRYPLMEPWPWITSITVLPSSTDIEVGETENFYAIATYSDGENEIVTHDADWTVNPAFGGSFIFAVILGYPYEIARFTLENKDFNVTVTASYMGYSDNALVFPWHASTVTFRLENLYAVHFATTFRLLHGSKIVVKFYTYGDGYENEKVIETFSPPWHVVENEFVRHPNGIGVKKVRLDLTTDDTENVISTVASFTVRKVDLETRFSRIPGEWFLAPPGSQERTDLETEFSRIPSAWFLAPS